MTTYVIASPVTAALTPMVKAVVETAVTAGNPTKLPPETTTFGVEEYAAPKVIVHAVAAVAVVTTPVTSLEPAESVPVPVPQVLTVGVFGVLDAVRCPYWST